MRTEIVSPLLAADSYILPFQEFSHPSTDEWIKKMWHIYTMEHYSAIKRNEIELFVVRWMDLESVIQNEVSRKGKQIPYANRDIWNLKRKKKWF